MGELCLKKGFSSTPSRPFPAPALLYRRRSETTQLHYGSGFSKDISKGGSSGFIILVCIIFGKGGYRGAGHRCGRSYFGQRDPA